MGVVDTCGGDAYWPYFEFVTRLVGVAPAAFDEGGPHTFPGECDAADLAFFAQQVAKRIDGAWRVVVVGAKDEQPWAVEQWVECLEEVGHGVDSPEVVAGVDHKVGRQLVQRGHPFFFCAADWAACAGRKCAGCGILSRRAAFLVRGGAGCTREG